MAHRLLTAPVRRMEGTARLPIVQDVGGMVTRPWWSSLNPQDALRRSRTSGSLISKGPLPSPQMFSQSAAGGTNSPENMRSGLRVRNAPRVANKTRGQSAGV